MKPRHSRRFLATALTSLSFAMSLAAASASTLYWDGSTSTVNSQSDNTTTTELNWLGGGNWDNGTTSAALASWLADDSAVLGGTAASETITAGALTVGNLTFGQGPLGAGTSGTAYTITGGTLTFSSSTVTTNTTTIINSALAGSFIKAGAGMLTLGSTANTAYTGTVTIRNGVLNLTNSSALGTGANANITLGDASTAAGDTLELRVGAAWASTGTITVNNYGAAAIINMSGGALSGTNLTFNMLRTTTFKTSGARDTNAYFTGGAGMGNDTIVVDPGAGNSWRNSAQAGKAADYTGNLHLKTGTLTTQNATYANSSYQNLSIPDQATLIIDSGASWAHTWGDETIGFLSGAGNITYSNNGTTTILYLAGLSTTATTGGATGTASYSGAIGSLATKLVKNGSGTQEFSGAFTMNGKPLDLNDGTLKLTNITSTFNSTGAINFGASNSPTLQLNAVASGDSWTTTKQITGGSANAKIEKTGLGTVVLTPAASSSFVGNSTGALTVTSGKLYLNGAFTTAPAVTVANGAIFGGTSTAGTITVANGGILEGGMAGTGTLTAGDVTLGASSSDLATLKGTLSTTAGYKPLAVTNLTLNGGANTVTLDAAGVGLTSGTYYDVLVSTNAITAPNNSGNVVGVFKSNSRAYTPNVDGTGTMVQLYYDANASVYWTGAASTAWNAGDTNWKLTGNNSDTQFQANDVVYFHDSPTNATVDISSGNVSPASVTFDNTTATSYTLQGSNGITTGTLVKSGDGTLTISNPNSYTGGTTLGAGTLVLNHNSALGSGAITITGGSINSTTAGIVLPNNPQNWNGDFSFAGTQSLNLGTGAVTMNAARIVTVAANTLTVGGAISSGGFGLTKSGVGALVLSGNSTTLSGGLSLSQGTLVANHASAMGVTTNTLVLGNASTGANPLAFKVDSGVAGSVTLASITNSNFGTSQIITLNSGSSLGANGAALITTLKLDGTVAVALKATNTAGHSTAQDVYWRIEGTGIAAGTTALTLDGTTASLRTSPLSSSSVASNFTGDVLIKGAVTTQNRTYNGNTAGNQNLGFLNNDVTVDTGATWTVVWGGETTGALKGSGTITLNNQSALNNIALTVGNNNRDGSFTGSLGSSWIMAKTGTGTQEFVGTGITISGGVNLDNGTLKLTKTTGWNSNIAVHAGNTATLQLNSTLATDSWTFAKQISGGSTNAMIEKTGLGTVVLTPAASSSFVGTTTGTLTATGGKLYLNNSNFTTAPAVAVADTATFGGSGTAGNITVSNGATLEGGMAGSGTLTAGDVTLGSTITDIATLKGTLSTTGGYKAIAVTNLTLNGDNQSVTLDASGLGLTSGATYDLLVSANPITAPNATSALAALKSTARSYTPVIDGTGTKIQLTYNATTSIYWAGLNEGGGDIWNTTSPLWKLTGDNSDTEFRTNDVVFFNDNPAMDAVFIEEGDVSPLAVTFANTSATNYTINGPNGIVTGSITKTGNGTVTFTSSNPTTGAIALNGGTVAISQTGGLGTGAITFDGGTLRYTGVGTTWTRALTVNAGGGTIGIDTADTILTTTGSLLGTGTLTKDGAGTLELGQTSGTVATNLQIIAGTLKLNYGAGNITYSGNLTGSAGVLQLEGTGASATTGLTLSGNNTFSGETHIYGRRIFLDSPTGNAIGGNVVIKNGNWAYHDLTINRNEQIADTAVLRFEQTNDAYDFRLNGKTETLAGIASLSTGQNSSFPIIENAGADAGNDTGLAAGTLNVSGSGTYAYYGQLRNQNGGSNGALNFGKSGAGSQTLSGGGISYTGTTTVNGGTLELHNTTSFASPAVAVNTGTLLLNHTTGSGSATGSSATITVESGATLAGVGTTTATTEIKASGIVAPGIAGIGTLNLTTATLSGTYQCDLGASTSDRINVTGTLTTSGTPAITFSGTPVANEYTIATIGTLSGDLPAITAPDGYVVDTTSVPGSIKLVKSAGYDSWLTDYTFAEGADTTPTGDPDGDGFTNLQEFLFGSNPTLSEGSLTTTESTGGNLVIHWKERATGCSYFLMESATLANDWIESTVIPEADGAQTGEYLPKKAQAPLGAGKKFFRIEGVEN